MLVWHGAGIGVYDTELKRTSSVSVYGIESHNKICTDPIVWGLVAPSVSSKGRREPPYGLRMSEVETEFIEHIVCVYESRKPIGICYRHCTWVRNGIVLQYDRGYRSLYYLLRKEDLSGGVVSIKGANGKYVVVEFDKGINLFMVKACVLC